MSVLWLLRVPLQALKVVEDAASAYNVMVWPVALLRTWL